MNDIEKLKKVNKLIPEMRRFGFAKTSDEAVKKTEEIFSTEIPDGFKSALGEGAPEKDAVASTVVEGSSFERLRACFEERLAGVESSVSNIIAKMNEIIKTVNDFEQRLAQRTTLKTASQAGVENNVVEKKEVGETQTVIVEPEAEPKKESNPKNGEFTPESIDIRHYFNFSNRS